MRERTPDWLMYLSTGFYSSSIFLMFLTGVIFLYLLLFTPLYPLPLLYFSWMVYDWNTPYAGGRRWKRVRCMGVWTYMAQYFPIRLVKTCPLEPDKNYLCALHPHGRITTGGMINLGTEATHFAKLFPGITVYGTSMNFYYWIPFARDALLALGMCVSSKESIDYLLSQKGKGNAVVLSVGGKDEAIAGEPYKMYVKLLDRKGFVKLAVKNGAHLVPIISFGENEITEPLVSRWLVPHYEGRLRFLLLCWAIIPFVFPFFPKRLPITTVVGKPIEVVRDENASEEVIDKYHQQYVQSLQQLFDEYKTKVGDEYKDMELVLF